MEKKKNVPVLRFPEFSGEWEKKKLGGLCESIVSGKTKPEIDGEFPVYGSTGIIGKSSNYTHDGKNLLVARVGANAGRINIANGKYSVTDNTLILNVNKNENIDFIFYYILVNDLNRLVFGSGQPLITGGQLKVLNVIKPQQKEQQQIASFLCLIDNKLQALKKKKTLLEQYKKGIMQKIFSQEIGFKDDNGEPFPKWEMKKLGSIIEEFKNNSKINNEFEVLTSSNRGLIPQKEYFGENRITDRDNIGFNIIPQGFITYRSRSDNGRFTFNLNDLGYTGIISTYYPVINFVNGSNYFMVEYLNFHWKETGRYSVGTSQLVLALNALTKIKLSIPTLDEQTKIANFLSAIDDKINLCNAQVEKTEQWKKGLLQKMFV